ncbi:acyltransferase [Caulobacter segnis]|uniref:Acyltransferase n=1 Tax=Caulobacter segnis TaxID=88688 RepID=A0A2W5VJA0_9CAUL|nr:acyltransferase [Caulobacter segnis]PZR35395.1 MAG: acyltransferase [Caulobacter segnis]
MGGYDYLRLAAAILVVAHHARVLDGRPPAILGAGADLGALGVGIFFVISGFLVAGSLARAPSVGIFVAKRALRIFPSLAVALLFTAFVLGPLVSAIDLGDYLGDQGPYGYVLRNLSLYAVTYDLPGVFLSAPMAGVVNGSLWTLRLEFTAYLTLAALGAARLATASPLASLAALAAGAAIGLHGLDLDARSDLFRVAYLASLNGFLFLAGAWLWTSRVKPPLWLAVLAVPLLATPVWFLALPALVVRLGALPLPRPAADLSYGLYIYSFPLQQMLAERGELTLMTSLAAVLPCAALSWFLVEKPALKLKSRLSPEAPRPVLSPAAVLAD